MINIYGDSSSGYADESLGPLEWSSWFKNEPSWLGLVRKFEEINVISSGFCELQVNLPNKNDKVIFLLTEKTQRPLYVCQFLKGLNIKTLVLTTDAKILEDMLYDWTTLNDSNFKIVDTQLEQVCHNEFHDGIIRDEIERERINHLSYKNHVTLYNIISNFFLGTKLSEKFHENLYHIKDYD